MFDCYIRKIVYMCVCVGQKTFVVLGSDGDHFLLLPSITARVVEIKNAKW